MRHRGYPEKVKQMNRVPRRENRRRERENIFKEFSRPDERHESSDLGVIISPG